MANNEYDRLKAEQERAFSAQQAAFKTLKAARDAQQAIYDKNKSHAEKRRAVKARLDAAWNAAESAKQKMNAEWQRGQDEFARVKSQRDYLSSQIDSAKAESDRLYREMSAAFSRASDAFQYGDKSMAPVYSSEGKEYKLQLDSANARVRALCAEAKALGGSSSNLSSYKSVYQAAKNHHASVLAEWKSLPSNKGEMDTAKSKTASAKAEFDRAKIANETAVRAIKDHIAKQKAEKQKRKQSDRELANQAGVPSHHDILVKKDSNGTVNIYFGGVGEPAGPGHGHYAMDSSGKITYTRNPFDPHGKDNFTDEKERKAYDRLVKNAIINSKAFKNTANKSPRRTQLNSSKSKVEVRSGYSRNNDAATTDLIIIDKENKDEHLHLIFDDNGNEIYSKWTENH